MAMNVGGSKGGPRADINVTPLVDVVLVLLIIFMVVTPKLQQGGKVDLPKAAVSREEKFEKTLIVAVDKDGAVTFDGAPVAPAELEALTKRRKAEDDAAWAQATAQARAEGRPVAPQDGPLVKGDKALRFGEVRKLMSTLRKAGHEKMMLAAEKAEDAK
jgi:biopolymer transport protein ExbD